jgi:hypothetical protein
LGSLTGFYSRFLSCQRRVAVSFGCGYLTLISLLLSDLENGDKTVMPDSALEHLLFLSIECLMLFKIKNPLILQTRHRGWLKFTAEEGMMYSRVR